MTFLFRTLSAPSLAVLLMLAGAAQAQVTEVETEARDEAPVSDPTFDYEADDPAVEARLTETERELQEFFDDPDPIAPTVRYTPDADPMTEKRLLRRAEEEMGEFNDIDDDDLAELGNRRTERGLPRLEKPGQLEKDLPIDCPAGTTVSVDGESCVAGPDFVFD